MPIAGQRWLLTVLFGWASLCTTGCAEMDILPSWVPFQGPASDTLPGITTPVVRITELRKLSTAAGQASTAEKQRISEQLANSIRTEKDPLIRTEIIRTLGVYPGASADAILKAAMNDDDASVRVAGCEAWGKRHDAQAVELLSAALTGDVETDVRLAAAKALGETQNSAAVKPLGDALNDDNPAMQYRAVLSLQKVTGKDLGHDVRRWQQYVRGETPAPPSLAERFRQWFRPLY